MHFRWEPGGPLRWGFVAALSECCEIQKYTEGRHLPGGSGELGGCRGIELLGQGKGDAACLSIHFHAGRGNNGRGAAGKGLCHGYRPVAENVGGAALVPS